MDIMSHMCHAVLLDATSRIFRRGTLIGIVFRTAKEGARK